MPVLPAGRIAPRSLPEMRDHLGARIDARAARRPRSRPSGSSGWCRRACWSCGRCRWRGVARAVLGLAGVTVAPVVADDAGAMRIGAGEHGRVAGGGHREGMAVVRVGEPGARGRGSARSRRARAGRDSPAPGAAAGRRRPGRRPVWACPGTPARRRRRPAARPAAGSTKGAQGKGFSWAGRLRLGLPPGYSGSPVGVSARRDRRRRWRCRCRPSWRSPPPRHANARSS